MGPSEPLPRQSNIISHPANGYLFVRIYLHKIKIYIPHKNIYKTAAIWFPQLATSNWVVHAPMAGSPGDSASRWVKERELANGNENHTTMAAKEADSWMLDDVYKYGISEPS